MQNKQILIFFSLAFVLVYLCFYSPIHSSEIANEIANKIVHDENQYKSWFDQIFESSFQSNGIATELVLEENVNKYAAGQFIDYFEDKEKMLTIDDISQLDSEIEFLESNNNVPSFGFTSSAYWFRLIIKNPFTLDKQIYLEIKNSYIDQLDFFSSDGIGGWYKKRTGELFPFETREIKNGTFIFKIFLPANKNGVYYLRFEGDSSLDVPLFIYTEEGFQESQYKKNIHSGIYFGIVSIMMFTSLFLFFQIRDLSLFYYFLYLAAQALVFLNFKGLTAQYLWPHYPLWANQAFFVFYALTHIAFLLFTRAFLDTAKHLKILDRILMFEIIILSACIIPGILAPYQVGVQFLMISVIIYQTTALIVGGYCYLKGIKSASYFLVAFTPMIIATIIFICLKMNFLSNSKEISDFFYLNSFIKLSLLSIAIIGRVKLLYDEKQVALEKGNLIKDEFLAKTSHELRTPLHGIIGIAESLLDKNSKNRLPKSVLKQLDVIMAAGKRLASLVNDIVDVSRLKDKEINLQNKPVDFYQIAEIVLTLCRSLTIGKDLVLINAIPKNISPVIGDEDRLQQIMHNLIGNAIKFTDRGEIKVTATEGNDRVTISIHDTGRGIPDDQLEIIFLNFEQVKLTGINYSQGAGLGLSIVRRLVELHGGIVEVVSQVGKGSIFSFDLPISSTPPEKTIELPLTVTQVDSSEDAMLPVNGNNIHKNKKNYNILVVDDEPINLQVVTNHLAEQGFNLQVVASGEEALTAIEKSIPHLVLLDVMMPKMSGFEVCRKIREKYTKSKIVIIFLTAKNQVTDLVEGFSLGANDYISKPFSKNELLTRVKYHLENFQMANRLVCLSEFACKISSIVEFKKIFQTAFQLIYEQISVDCGVLILNEKIIDKIGSSRAKFAVDEILLENNKDDKEISFHHFHTSELMRIHPRYFKEFNIVVIKDGHQMFNKVDIEFIRNILTTIKITRDNLREIISDGRLLSGLNQIRERLHSVVCIKSQRNYCSIICENNSSESFELRISIQKIQTFFKDSELLKINRSTLINPAKVQSLQRIAKQKYSVEMINDDNLPISRTMEKQVRSFFDDN